MSLSPSLSLSTSLSLCLLWFLFGFFFYFLCFWLCVNTLCLHHHHHHHRHHHPFSPNRLCIILFEAYLFPVHKFKANENENEMYFVFSFLFAKFEEQVTFFGFCLLDDNLFCVPIMILELCVCVVSVSNSFFLLTSMYICTMCVCLSLSLWVIVCVCKLKTPLSSTYPPVHFEFDTIYIPCILIGEYSCLKVDLLFKREFSYYLIQIYIPCCMLVIVSWVSFWLDQGAVPARVSLGKCQ